MTDLTSILAVCIFTLLVLGVLCSAVVLGYWLYALLAWIVRKLSP